MSCMKASSYADTLVCSRSPNEAATMLSCSSRSLLRAVSSSILCRGKSLQTVSELLKVAASTTITNKLALTPLAEALVSGRTENAQLLVEKVRLVGQAEINLPAVASYIHEFPLCDSSFWQKRACRGKSCTLGNTPENCKVILLLQLNFRTAHVEFPVCQCETSCR